MHEQGRNRAGFTLIELLVVIAIIAILIALTVRGTFQVIQSQQVSNSETLIRTVNQTLEKQWAQVIADAKKETGIPDAVRALAGNDEDRARIIWIKFRLMEAFPMNYGEINSNPLYTPVSYIPSDKRKYQAGYFKKLNGKTSGPYPDVESSACLLMALSVTRAGTVLTESGLGSNAADTDSDGLKEIVDSFGKPLAFFRFPTNNLFLMRSNTTGQPGDPLDPKGKLSDPNWSNRGAFQSVCNYTVLNGTQAYYTSPTLVSAGRNQILGLSFPDMSIVDPGGSDDNIYSFRLREGAQGN